MTSMHSLAGKVALISGGGGGIGSATGRRLGVAGARVVLADLDQAAVQQRVAHLQSEGLDAAGYPLDVTDPQHCAAVVDRVVGDRGGLDLLVHCAGITHVSPFLETQLEVHRRVMEVNYWGAVALTQAAMGPLLQRRGQIIVLSSIAGFAPLLARSGYCASKHALHGFFDTLRTELHGSGVHVTLVCPSFVDTDFANHGLRGDGRQLDFERSTSGRALTADQVAQAIFRATRSRPRQVVLSPLGRLSYWLTRWAPAWYDRLMIRRFQVELARPRTADSPTP